MTINKKACASGKNHQSGHTPSMFRIDNALDIIPRFRGSQAEKSVANCVKPSLNKDITNYKVCFEGRGVTRQVSDADALMTLCSCSLGFICEKNQSKQGGVYFFSQILRSSLLLGS